MKKLFTSESVTEGHPDKLCDLISDTLLDAYLEQDKESRVAIETAAGKNKIFITGEVTSKAGFSNEQLTQIVRKTIYNIGYFGDVDISYRDCEIEIRISKQSSDIDLGVSNSLEIKNDFKASGASNIDRSTSVMDSLLSAHRTAINAKAEASHESALAEGAGDQGMVFGYACSEMPNYMPATIFYAHALTKALTDARKNGNILDIGPDGKSQVTVEYDENDNVKRIECIVIAIQHKDTKSVEVLRKEVMEKVIKKVIPPELLDDKTKYFINATGRFVTGGPLADAGLTGRKTIVDTYGSHAHHGGGAFSGKDPSKVDRSGAYMARYIAKNIVANGYAKKCEIQIAYIIGVARPASIYINTFGTNTIPEDDIINIICSNFDLTPLGIINTLDLKRPIYTKTTNYGHFGKDDLPWERIIKI
jgi:S-adenosylmethionine synthetase